MENALDIFKGSCLFAGVYFLMLIIYEIRELWLAHKALKKIRNKIANKNK